MSVSEGLYSASYKDFLFLVSSVKTTGGQNDVKHKFPNSDRQTIERLGLAPKSFEFKAIISGEDYFDRRDTFLGVLEQEGAGPLIHPFYGRLENYIARKFILNETMTSVGAAEILITFDRDDGVGIIEATDTSVGDVETANAAFIESLNADIASEFGVDVKNVGNFQAAIDVVNDVVDAVNEALDFVDAIADQITAISSQINDLASNITTLIQSPQALADSITGIFTSIDNLFTTVEATTDVLKGLFGFGDDNAEIIPTTAGLIERRKNEKVITATITSAALGYGYLNAVQGDYATVDDVELAADQLDDQFKKVLAASGVADEYAASTVVSDKTKDAEYGMSEETKALLTDVRVKAQNIFDQKKLTSAQIVETSTTMTSARLLGYQYYADSSRGDEIINANDIQEVSFVDGTIKVISA